MKNCFDHLLSDPELSVLKKGQNIVVTPCRVPVVEIVTAMESACNGDAHELRPKVVQLLDREDKVMTRM